MRTVQITCRVLPRVLVTWLEKRANVAAVTMITTSSLPIKRTKSATLSSTTALTAFLASKVKLFLAPEQKL